MQESCAVVLRLSQQRAKGDVWKIYYRDEAKFLDAIHAFFFFKYTALRISLTQSHRDTQNLPPPDPFSETGFV